MGDRAWMGVCFFAVPAATPHRLGPGFAQQSTDERVLALLREYGFYEVFDDNDTDLTTAIDIDVETTIRIGASYTAPEARLGTEEELGPALDALGVTYEIDGDSFGQYDACVRYGTPHLGSFSSSATADEYEPFLNARQIERLIAECDTHQELIDRLALATGKAWRDFFKRATLPPTEEDMRLARLSLLRAEEALSDV